MAMRTQSKDTHIKVEEKLIALMRQATPSQKFAHIRSLSETMLNLSWRAILRKNRHLNTLNRQWLYIKYQYGQELADRYKKNLEQRENEKSGHTPGH
jgi:hypothetical protein